MLLLVLLAVAADDPWNQFRGPGGSGVAKDAAVPTTFDDVTNVAWKTPIHDKGWSSPVLLGKNVWVTTAKENGTAQWAVALDRDTGKVVHDVKLFDTPKPPYTFVKDYNSHASPTPAVEPGRVYAHFGSTGTACLDADTGKVLWTNRELKCDHWRAPGASPILWGDYVLVGFDGYDKQFVVAFDKATGKVVWKQDRTIDCHTTNGDLKKAYATGLIVNVEGKPHFVVPAAGGTEAYDPRTGKPLWKVEYPGMNAATPPQVAGGLVFVTSGHTSTLYAIDPTGSGDVTKTHVRWTIKGSPSRPAPIVLGDLLLMVNDSGFATAHDAATGKELWKRRLPGSAFYSSPVVAGGHLFVGDREGKVHVVTAGREGKVVAANRLDGGIEATPAVSGDAMFVRTSKYLYRIEKK